MASDAAAVSPACGAAPCQRRFAARRAGAGAGGAALADARRSSARSCSISSYTYRKIWSIASLALMRSSFQSSSSSSSVWSFTVRSPF
jgi:hypothetical protein